MEYLPYIFSIAFTHIKPGETMSEDKTKNPPEFDSQDLEMARIIIDNSPVVLFRRIAGEDPKLTYVSDNIRNYGYSARELLSGEIMFKDLVYSEDSDRISEEIKGFAEQNIENYNQWYRIVTRDGDIRWLEDRTSVIRNEYGIAQFNQGVLVDITERKEIEVALAKSEEKYRRIVSTASEGFLLANRDMKIIDANQAFCKLLGYSLDEIIGKPPVHFATPEFRAYLVANEQRFTRKGSKKIEGEFITRQKKPVPVILHSSPLTDDDNNFLGTMAFVTDMTEHKKALALASEVQKSLLPQAQPRINGFDIAGKNRSCDEIGGDYFDFILQGTSRRPVHVVIGDVTGHGVDAALFMTTARGFLRMRAAQPGDAGQIITDMNRHLSKDVLESGRFMTLFFISLDPDSRQLQWVRAGHDPALVYDPSSDRFETLMGKGSALGVDDMVSYAHQSYPDFTAGKIIALGTDGIWESFNSNGTMYGKDRFKKVIRENGSGTANDIVDAVFSDIDDFTAGHRVEDDITLVIIKREGKINENART